MPEFISLLRWIRDTAYPTIVSAVTSVSNDKASIEAVASTLDSITTVSNSAILSADNAADSEAAALASAGASALSATQSANSASASAGSAQSAQNVLSQISGVTAQASTLSPGALATASYNPADGKLSFGIPRGDKGERGDNFTPNAQGLFANRVNYDSQNEGFAYLASDTGYIYFKLSNTVADWSAGFPFGKGETGDTGVQGIGISSIARTSGNGSPGTTDIYTVTLTDTTTYTFSVYNGANGQVKSVAGRIGAIVLTKADVGLSNVDNTSDLNKPISNATQNAINTTQNAINTTQNAINTTQNAINTKQNTLVNQTNIKSINNKSLLGSGNLDLTSSIKTTINASGKAPIYACRAWVNFNGTRTVAIRASGNVSSITDKGTGNYTTNFIVAMSDSNYAAAYSYCSIAAPGNLQPFCFTYSKTSRNISLRITGITYSFTDNSDINVTIFR